MAVPPRKKSFSRRRNSRGRFLALLLLLMVAAGITWFWWHQHQRHPHKTSRHKIVSHTQAVWPVVKTVLAPIPVPPPPASQPNPTSVPTPAPTPPAAVSPPAVAPVVVAPPAAGEFPRPARDALEVQIALARRVISPGSIDAAIGSQTRAALAAFQQSQHLLASGTLDTNTRSLLTLDTPILTTYTVTTNDLASLQPLVKTWLEKSRQSSLAYETELESVGETAHSNPLLIKKLNPGVDWANIAAGDALKIPDVEYPEPADKAAFVVIHLSQRFLEAFDQQTNLMAHFPCSIAAKVDKRPVGELNVIVIIQNPNYTVNPELFPESDELRAIGHKLILPPGPNNPVGVAWIGLDRPGYGMHGTPVPEQVGRTESHGCFRLANWDAEYLVKLAWVGMPVYVEP
jgi:lipoprotein-anchoring transpeptidase ErfK/SrfK